MRCVFIQPDYSVSDLIPVVGQICGLLFSRQMRFVAHLSSASSTGFMMLDSSKTVLEHILFIILINRLDIDSND